MALVQHDRLIHLTTPLGKDVLHVETLEGSEGISRPFRFQLVLASEKRDIALGALVGQRVTVALEVRGGKFRYVNGFVSRFAQGDVDARVAHYYAEVVPWLWFLTRTTDCRIFQRKNVPDIIQQIFKDLGFTDFKVQLQGNFEPREYCVQYRETDLNFVSRLMEEEGIFYFFEHTDSKHTLILANDPITHQPCPNQPQAGYDYLAGGDRGVDTVTRWHLEQELQPGKVTLADYHFQAPGNSLRVSAPSGVNGTSNGKFEVYDYPGYFAKRFDGDGKTGKVRPDGERTAKLGMQGADAFHKVVNGAGGCRAFLPGYRFELTGHRRGDFNGPYVLTEVTHSATNNLGDGEGCSYDNTFTCIPLAVPFRPARTTPRPLVHGSQTAVVVGTPGEEIDTDKYGRIKVQFHWDREGKKDQDSSCWIRVATPWAGKGWGTINIPRIGQEVVVQFLEGDPDQPIVLGSFYNAEHMPPFPLPAAKNIAGLKSNSTRGGGGYNELTLDDTKGKEKITIHAQKDMGTTVENDQSNTVKGKFTETITKDTEITIQTGKLEHTVADNTATYTVKKDLTETYHADQSTTVEGNLKIDVTGAAKGGGKVLLHAKEEIVLHTGASKLTMRKDGTILLEGVKITVKGSEKLKEDAPDVEITGSKTAKIGVGPQNTVYDTTKVGVSGAAINSSAVGIHEITGAIVKIN
jgi:type VI secretion system secreted protein VgrG